MSRTIEAERAVLGALILRPEHLDEVLEVCRFGDFEDSRHAVLFRALCTLVEKRVPVDFVSIRLALEERGELGAVGGLEYVLDLAGCVTSAARVVHHAGLVSFSARVRRAREAFDEASRECGEVHVADIADATQHLDAIEQAVFAKLAERREVARSTRMDVLIERRRERLERRREGEIDGLSTGIYDVDALMGGMKPGWMILVGARTSGGKSAFSMQVSRNVASAGHPVLYVSYEMFADQAAERMMKHDPGELSGAPFDFVRPIDKSVMALRAMVRRHKRVGLELLVLDYIQNMSERGHESRLHELAAISRGIQLLAAEYEIPVIAAAQLSREADKEAPKLRHLRECGSFEQDADVVILLSDGKQPPELVCDFAKHRHGATGARLLAFFKDQQRIADLSPLQSNVETIYP